MTDMDPLDTPNCPVCLRPMEVQEVNEVLMWECGHGCDLDRE